MKGIIKGSSLSLINVTIMMEEKFRNVVEAYEVLVDQLKKTL